MPTLPTLTNESTKDLIIGTKSAVEFEQICKDVIQIYLNIKMEPYGRNGQTQKGIDIISKRPTTGVRYTVAQCKNFNTKIKSEKLLEIIEKEYNKRSDLPFDIDQYIFLTASKRDVKVQNEIRKKWPDNPPVILFWDEIQEIILNTPSLIQKHYPFLRITYDNTDDYYCLRKSHMDYLTQQNNAEFYNPFNTEEELGKVIVRPKHLMYDGGNFKATCYIINGLDNEIEINRMDRLAFKDSSGYICDANNILFDINPIISAHSINLVTITFKEGKDFIRNRKKMDDKITCEFSLYYVNSAIENITGISYDKELDA